MSVLYVVGTPIGNLEDITLRALKILSSVDLILCEDTRVTKRLLERHGIRTPTLSYHAHSKLSRVEEIIGLLREGKDLALVSDAGIPGISDPGAELVARVRAVSEPLYKSKEVEKTGRLYLRTGSEAIRVESIPGPSALTAALSVAGVPLTDGFVFMGFLPHKKGRETLFKEIALSERPVVFYESPHRIMKALQSLETHLKGAERPKKVTVCRELTKVFEETVSGSPAEARIFFESNPDKVRGEFVVIVS